MLPRLVQTGLSHLDRAADTYCHTATDARGAIPLARKIEARRLGERCGICIVVHNDPARPVNFRDRICNGQGSRSCGHIHRHDAPGPTAVRSAAQILNAEKNLVPGSRGSICVVKLRCWSAFRAARGDREGRSIHSGIHRSYGIWKRTCGNSTRIREADALDRRGAGDRRSAQVRGRR